LSRIFTTLSVLASVLLVINLALGFSVGQYNRVARQWIVARSESAQTARADDVQAAADAKARLQAAWARLKPVEQRKRWHVWSGIAVTLVVLLLNSLTVTYFIGTSRWCREVADAYALGDSLVAQSLRLKRSNFPWALGSAACLLVIIGLGAASDLTANFNSAEQFVLPHALTATAGTAWIIWSFRVQARKLAQNQQTINQVLQRAQEIQRDSVHSASQ
jgi:hypothetical protein